MTTQSSEFRTEVRELETECCECEARKFGDIPLECVVKPALLPLQLSTSAERKRLECEDGENWGQNVGNVKLEKIGENAGVSKQKIGTEVCSGKHEN